MKSIVLFIFLFVVSYSYSQVPYQIKDVNPGPDHGVGYSYSVKVCSNGKYYFIAQTDLLGKELWVTDGTDAGTHLVKDINAGSGDSFIGYFLSYVPYNNGILFQADDGVTGNELWYTDGTEPGTYLVKDIYLGPTSSLNNMIFKEFNGLIYFFADDGVNGLEVYVTDGSPIGTQILKNINPLGSGVFGGYYSNSFVEYNGDLYFIANDGNSGFELWKTDGSEIGTYMLYDINPGIENGFENGRIENIEFDHSLFFVGISSISGKEIWKTDGTYPGTQILKDINPNGDAIFTNYGANFIAVHGKMYFSAYQDSYGTEIWTSDGTNMGTHLFYDLYPGSSNGAINPKSFSFNNDLFFLGRDGVSYRELWKTDGLSLNKLTVNNITNNGIKNFVNLDGVIYFIGWSANGHELWRSDGTVSGTYEVKDIAPGSSDGIEPGSELHVYQSKLYFEARDIIYHEALWTSDGTSDGTYEMKDPATGNQLNDPSFHSKDCNNFYISASEGITGHELWGLDLNEVQSVQENVDNGIISVYPNPSTGTFLIDNLQFEGEFSIDLFDINMKLISHESYQDVSSIEFSKDVEAGVYFLRFTSSAASSTKQIIIQ